MSNDGPDSLSSSFASSFSLPPPEPKPAAAEPSSRGATDVKDEPQLIIGGKENDDSKPPASTQAKSATEQGSDPSEVANKEDASPAEDWKASLDKNLEAWRAESSVARTKAESTRLRHEEELAQQKKKEEQERKDAARRVKQEAEDAEVERKLKESMSSKGRKSRIARGKHAAGPSGGRWESVRDAWEIVRDDGELAAVPADKNLQDDIEVDGRDMVDGDEGGSSGKKVGETLNAIKEAVNHGAGNSASTKADPTPRASSPRADKAALDAPERSADDRREAVSKAWKKASNDDEADPAEPVDASAPQTMDRPGPKDAHRSEPAKTEKLSTIHGSGSADDKKPSSASGSQAPSASMSVPHSDKKIVQEATEPVPSRISPAGLSLTDSSGGQSRPGNNKKSGPPEQPPSLTLSLFTMPTHRSLLRFSAVLGINLILPFINGVMLGFGEIFARETVAWGKSWWRGEVTFRGPGSTQASVGLREGARRSDATSGSGSFP